MNTRRKFFLLFFLFLLLPLATEAASLGLSPGTGQLSVGQSFTVNIVVSTPEQAMNAVSGVLTFPADLLEVTSLSKGASIVGLWVQEPSFSNNSGTVNFEGVALNPGFTGTAGRVLGINFRAKRAGSAKLGFLTPAVLANDGQGTNILESSGEANFQVGEKKVLPVVPVAAPVTGVEGSDSLNISSPTHPDPTKWYRASTARFSWDLPAGVTGMRLSASHSATTIPSVIYDQPITEKEITDLEDGVWYFHGQYQVLENLSDTTHFRFQVDTKAPSHFTITEGPRSDQTIPQVKLVLDASDETSGIDYYEVKSDNQNLPLWRGKKGETYTTPALTPGSHTITARAFDRAGNSLAASLDVVVTALLSPTWTDYPTSLGRGEVLVAKGRTYPNLGVIIAWQRDNDAEDTLTVKSDDSGNFSFIAPDRLADGVYKIMATARDDRGASSLPSEPIMVAVSPPGWWRLGAQAITLLSVVVPLLALVFALGFLLYQSYHRFRLLRRKLHKEVQEAEESISKAFDLLREDLEKQLSLLEKTKSKRDLTKEESKILTHVRKNLRIAEKFIEKELADIERQVK